MTQPSLTQRSITAITDARIGTGLLGPTLYLNDAGGEYPPTTIILSHLQGWNLKDGRLCLMLTGRTLYVEAAPDVDGHPLGEVDDLLWEALVGRND